VWGVECRGQEAGGWGQEAGGKRLEVGCRVQGVGVLGVGVLRYSCFGVGCWL